MFDLTPYREEEPRRTQPAELRAEDLARQCREPAELWVLERRRNRPSAVSNNLPRVVVT